MKHLTLKDPSTLSIQLPDHGDERGVLVFLEGGHHIPFSVARVFWIYGVPGHESRGGHAHWSCHEAVFAVHGSFELELKDGKDSQRFLLNDPSQGVLIPAGVWCELRHFSADAVCVVMASEPYSPQGYVHDYEDYVRAKERQ